MALILRNGGSQSPDRWLKEPRNNQHPMNPSIFRQKNHLTQKELGMAVGFPDNCADVRIAQYESDVRTPKEDLLKLFASTLSVPVELFTVPVLSEPREYETAEYWRYEFGAELG